MRRGGGSPEISLHFFNNTYVNCNTLHNLTFLKPILYYAFGLRFGNVCEHKREKNSRKTQEKREKNANGSRF